MSTPGTITNIITTGLQKCPTHWLPRCNNRAIPKVQKIAARIILNKIPRNSATQCLKSLHTLPIQYMIDYKVATLVFKSSHDMAPKYLKELLTEKNLSRRGLCTANKISYSPYQIKQEKHLFQDLSASVDKLYGAAYQTILGPQQTTIKLQIKQRKFLS